MHIETISRLLRIHELIIDFDFLVYPHTIFILNLPFMTQKQNDCFKQSII